MSQLESLNKTKLISMLRRLATTDTYARLAHTSVFRGIPPVAARRFKKKWIVDEVQAAMVSVISVLINDDVKPLDAVTSICHHDADDLKYFNKRLLCHFGRQRMVTVTVKRWRACGAASAFLQLLKVVDPKKTSALRRAEVVL